MKRRTALKNLSLGLGYTMTYAGMAAFVTSCNADNPVNEVASTWKPTFLKEEQSTMLTEILDAMLPTTKSSPGFKDLNLIQVLDNVANKLYKKEDQITFSAGLVDIAAKMEASKDINGFMKTYMTKKPEGEEARIDKLIDLDREEVAEGDINAYNFHKTIDSIRSIGISAYFTNEIIGTEYLSYDPIPGKYVGCMPVSEVGNVWAL